MDNVQDRPYTDSPKRVMGNEGSLKNSEGVESILQEAREGCVRMAKFRESLNIDREMYRSRAADLRNQAEAIDRYVEDINEFLNNDGFDGIALEG